MYQQKTIFKLLATPMMLAMIANAYAEPIETIDQLPEVVVSEKNSAAKADAYHVPEASGATKTGTPLREVPQAVTVLPRAFLNDTSALRLNDSLDYASGVARQNNFGGLWDNIAIRGFAGHEDTGMSLLRNGFPANRGFNATRDLANIESIEFLKGPSAALYGNSEPGGTVNIVTKKPQFTPSHTLEASLGSYDSKRLALDSTDKIGTDVAYRLNVAAEDNGSFRDYIDSKRLLIAPALTWVISDNTLLSYDGEYLRHDAPFDRGITRVNGKLFAMDRESFLGYPEDGDTEQTNQTHQLSLEHQFSAQWKARLGAAYKHNTLEGWGAELPIFIDVTTDTVNLRRRYRDFSSDDLTLRAEVEGKVDLAGLQHTLLMGLENSDYELDQLMRNRNNAVRVSNITSSPVYTLLNGDNGVINMNRTQKQENTAVYVQDEISLTPNWRVLLGLRHDRYDQEIENHRNNTVASREQSAVSPRAGLTWLIDNQWSWYVTVGESFRPNPNTDAAGNMFKAEEGRAVDSGIKFESADKRLGASVSVFHIEKENVLTGSDPDGVFSVAAGEVRSQGLEFDMSGKIGNHWRALANYAYTDAEVTKDTGGAVDWISGDVVNLEGKQLSNIPRHKASLFAMWEDHADNGGSWGVGAGLTYVGERSGNYIDSFRLPAYTTAKLVSYWNIDQHWRLKLNVDNLFDREYIAASYDSHWLTPGAPRTATVSVAYKF